MQRADPANRAYYPKTVDTIKANFHPAQEAPHEEMSSATRSLLRKSHMTHQMTTVGEFLFFGLLTLLWKRGEGEILFRAYRYPRSRQNFSAAGWSGITSGPSAVSRHIRSSGKGPGSCQPILSLRASSAAQIEVTTASETSAWV